MNYFVYHISHHSTGLLAPKKCSKQSNFNHKSHKFYINECQMQNLSKQIEYLLLL